MGGAGVLNLHLLFCFKFLILTARFSLATPSLLGSILPTNTNATTTTTTTAAPPASPSSNSSTVFQTYVTREQRNNFMAEFDKMAAYLSQRFNGPVAPNPNAGLSTCEIATKNGYLCENHTVTTGDGYILTLHRIPCGKSNTGSTATPRPVLIGHGLSGGSSNFVFQDHKSLAFLLADAGYDVWLYNARGNEYSRGHTIWTTENSAYWNFSFHEMGKFDLPACLDYILGETGFDKLSYVGYSMGSTCFFVMASECPDHINKIDIMIAMSAIASLNNVQAPCFSALAPIMGLPGFSEASRALGQGEFVQNEFINSLRPAAGNLCIHQGEPLCAAFLCCMAGFDYNNVDTGLFHAAFTSIPSPTSIKTWAHYAQGNLCGEFRQFELLPLESAIEYGLMKPPPKYNMANINCHMHFIMAQNDRLSTQKDVQALLKLNPNAGSTNITNSQYGHLSYMLGEDVVTQVYNLVLTRLNAVHNPQ